MDVAGTVLDLEPRVLVVAVVVAVLMEVLVLVAALSLCTEQHVVETPLRADIVVVVVLMVVLVLVLVAALSLSPTITVRHVVESPPLSGYQYIGMS